MMVLLSPAEKLMKHAWPLAAHAILLELVWAAAGSLSSPPYSSSKDVSLSWCLSINFSSPLGTVPLTSPPTVPPVSKLYLGTM